MADKEDTSMIGYDPLAWMHESENQKQSDFPSDPELADSWFEFSEQSEMPGNANDLESTIEIQEDTAMRNDVQVIEVKDDSVLHADFLLPTPVKLIVLESVQNIQNVGQLHEQCLLALDNGEKIDIDASAIKAIDTATLQLLLILKQTAIKQQKVVTIDFPSDKFIEATNLLGLSQMLNVDQAVSGFF